MKKSLYLAVALLGGLALMLALVLLVGQAVPVRADFDVLYVAPSANCNGASPCYDSIQAAVDAASAGDEIRIAAGTYIDMSMRPREDFLTTGLVTQVVYISKTLTMRGGYTTSNWIISDPETNPTILDAQGQGRVLYITGDISPTIESLSIANGDAMGLLGNRWSSLDTGGGVYGVTAIITLRGCSIYSNTAEYGGGLAVFDGHLALSDSTIVTNSASDLDGGGVVIDKSTGIVERNMVSQNIADRHGGGLFLGFSDDVVLNDNVIANNTAGLSSGGGGLYSWGGKASLSRNHVAHNSPGGLFLFGGQFGAEFKVTRNDIVSNTGSRPGVTVSGDAVAVLSGNRISNNASSSDDRGGGVHLWTGCVVTMVNNSIVDNVAGGNGCGLYVEGSTAFLLHNTMARNAGGDGSGLYVTNSYWGDYSSVALTNTILVSHSLGISVTGGNTVTINGILWHNTPITISRSTTASVTIQNQYRGNPTFVDPDIGDYHINATSAALDTGVDAGVTDDVDGDVRLAHPLNLPDLGADENTTLTVQRPVVMTTTFGAACARLVFTDAGGLQSITVTARPGQFPTSDTSDGVISRTVIITPSSSAAFSATLALRYDESELGSLNETHLQLYRWTESGWVSHASTTDTIHNTVTAAEVTGFSAWVIGVPNQIPTAVSLVALVGDQGGQSSVLALALTGVIVAMVVMWKLCHWWRRPLKV
jgi:hypothetical protein